MKILVCHEFYRQFGGEDQSFLDEVSMLRAKGHEVVEYTRRYDDIAHSTRIRTAIQSVWNAAVYQELRSIIQREHPHILHCTNLFPLISPAAYKAAHDEHVPVVQALRNYRIVCPGAKLVRDGKVCEKCLGKAVPWPAVRHNCYQNSRLGSTVAATAFGIHNVNRTWRHVDCFYTPSHFARSVFIRAGIPAEQIEVKPNTVVPDPGVGSGDGGYALFAGRLEPEKGIATLLNAWAELEEDLPLHIVGDGPCRNLVEKAAAQDTRIFFLGEMPHREVIEKLRSATCLVMPSEWYETFGRTIVEAYATGTPVIASRMGAMEELLVHAETGLLFEPGSASSLSHAISKFCHRSDLLDVRRRARREFEDKYSIEQSYNCLMTIYDRALDRFGRGTRSAGSQRPQERLIAMGESHSELETRSPRIASPGDPKTRVSALPLVCVYVVTYNGKRFLKDCFRSLEHLTDYPNHQLILADNGSSDGSGEYVLTNFPQVDILRVFPNVGWSHGANAAINDARQRGAKYVALLNDDIKILHTEWLREAVTHAERDQRIGTISFPDVASDSRLSEMPKRTIIDIKYPGSCALVMPVELFDRIGMFDELYHHLGDDDDLGARAQVAGYRTVLLDIPIYHFGASIDQKYSFNTAYLQMRNGIRFCIKNRTPMHAVLRALRIIDLACNPWPLAFDKHNLAHRRIRNSGNLCVNLLLWLRAVSWNIVRFRQTLSTRAAERGFSRAARARR